MWHLLDHGFSVGFSTDPRLCESQWTLDVVGVQASEVNRLFGVSRSLGVEGARSSLHFKEADLAEVVGLAVEDLVEVILADRGRVIVHCDALLTGSWGKTLLGFFSYTMSGESSPGSSTLPSTISTLGNLLKSGVLPLLDVWLDCTLAGRPRGRSLTIVGFTILPSWFFYKDNNHEKFNICHAMDKRKKLTLGGDRGALLMGRKCRFSSASMLLLLSSLGHLLFLLNFSSNNGSSSHGKLLFLFGWGISKQLPLLSLFDRGSKSCKRLLPSSFSRFSFSGCRESSARWSKTSPLPSLSLIKALRMMGGQDVTQFNWKRLWKWYQFRHNMTTCVQRKKCENGNFFKYKTEQQKATAQLR